MPVPINTPHSVTLKRGAVSRDADNNAASRDFTFPSLTKTVKGLFQVRTGDVSQDGEGRNFSLDGIFYTLDKDIQLDDLLEVSLPGITDKFRVADRDPKFDINGLFSHMEIPLERDARVKT